MAVLACLLRPFGLLVALCTLAKALTLRPPTLQARAQSDEYTTRMNTYKFDSGTFGSKFSVPEVDEGSFRYKP